MKIYQRTLQGKLNRHDHKVELTINAADQKHLEAAWDQFFTVLLGDIEFFTDHQHEVPTHIELFLDHTYETVKTKASRIDPGQNSEALSNDLFSIVEPRYTMADIILPEAAKKELEEIVFYCSHKAALERELIPAHLKSHAVGVYINFFGPSGTGKTMAVEIMANRLGRKLMVVNYANLESELVGRTSKNIHTIFKIAARRDCLLMFNEADSFLSARITNLRQSADYGVNTSRSQLLKELEAYQGVVIFATNHIQNYDPAFQRRLHFNVHFPLPDPPARLNILQKLCFSPRISAGVDLRRVAEKIEGFSGGDIQNLVKRAMIKGLMDIADGRAQAVEEEHFLYGVEAIQASKAAFGLGKEGPRMLNIENLPLARNGKASIAPGPSTEARIAAAAT